MRRGFTLIELIIVVIVIGILATIAIPQYLKAVERAQIGKAKAALGMIISAEKMYSADHNGTESEDLAVNGALDKYVEMNGIGDAVAPWTYEYSHATTTATATRVGGNYGGQHVSLTSNGVWGGDHSLLQ